MRAFRGWRLCSTLNDGWEEEKQRYSTSFGRHWVIWKGELRDMVLYTSAESISYLAKSLEVLRWQRKEKRSKLNTLELAPRRPFPNERCSRLCWIQRIYYTFEQKCIWSYNWRDSTTTGGSDREREREGEETKARCEKKKHWTVIREAKASLV